METVRDGVCLIPHRGTKKVELKLRVRFSLIVALLQCRVVNRTRMYCNSEFKVSGGEGVDITPSPGISVHVLSRS